MPKQRKKSTISDYDFVCALLYIIENGFKWRALLKGGGNWRIGVSINFVCVKIDSERRLPNSHQRFIVLPENNHNALKGRVLIGNIISRDNFSLLINRVYENEAMRRTAMNRGSVLVVMSKKTPIALGIQ